MSKKTSRPPPFGRRTNRSDGRGSDPKIMDLSLIRLTRALERTLASRTETRCSYIDALSRQLAIKRATRSGPARLIVGFLRILLIVENWPRRGWLLLDYFPLMSETDHDLLLVTDEMQHRGYGRPRVKAELTAAVFSPRGANDPEAKAAMARLGRRGFSTSSQIVGIRDPELLRWADGEPQVRHSRRRQR